MNTSLHDESEIQAMVSTSLHRCKNEGGEGEGAQTVTPVFWYKFVVRMAYANFKF